MNILVFDTSAETLAVGVKISGDRFSCRVVSGAKHSAALLPEISACLDAAGISMNEIGLIACSGGPGSFTGLRIGMATAKGLSLALGIPWVSAPTLDGIALSHEPGSVPVLPVIDARKNRIYSAVYQNGSRVGEYLDVPVAELLRIADSYESVRFVGPDAEIFSEYCLERPGFSVEKDDSESILRAFAAIAEGKFQKEGPAPEDEGPFYIREPEIG